MKQAVFVDYTGTLVKEDGPDLHGVVRAICANSDEKDPRRALAFWWHRLKQYEAASFGPAFLTQDEIVQRILADCERQLHLQADKAALHAGIRRFWASAPLFEDAPAFRGVPGAGVGAYQQQRGLCARKPGRARHCARGHCDGGHGARL